MNADLHMARLFASAAEDAVLREVRILRQAPPETRWLYIKGLVRRFDEMEKRYRDLAYADADARKRDSL